VNDFYLSRLDHFESYRAIHRLILHLVNFHFSNSLIGSVLHSHLNGSIMEYLLDGQHQKADH